MTEPEPDTAADTGADTAASLAALQAKLSVLDGLDDFDELHGPTYWPALTADDAEAEWESLRRWVEAFRSRFPHATKLPDCWYCHADLVEALAALRDHERASFSSTAPPTAAVEWHRAFRDMESRMECWIKRFTCVVSGRGHEPPPAPAEPDAAWAEFVRADIDRRRTRQIELALD